MNRELAPRRRLRAVAALLSMSFVALAVAACEDELRASDYDQSCDVAADCVGIETGAPDCCNTWSCNPDAAINKSDLGQFEADFDAAKTASCRTPVACPQFACEPGVVACVKNRCEVVQHGVPGGA